ncbi:EFR1 family ferrodoxin [Methanimicrococcus sp. OttesenSCG-928-J09]|nr:EFR1 family ferrodoxin [Methanimicrococcus sp. OttesenSCG-928-J09]
MTHRIYYFSATGNSLQIARKLAESLPNSELIPITPDLAAELQAAAEASDSSKGDSSDGFDNSNNSNQSAGSNETSNAVPESVGIVFPVYMFKPPRIVLEFLRKMPKADYIYAVATCGMMPGKPLTVIKNIMLKQGMALSAGYVIPLVSNFIVLPKTKSKASVEKAFKKAEAKTQQIGQNVQKKTAHFDKETPDIIAKPVAWLGFNPMYRKIPELDKKFSVNSRCNKCGTCRDVCPVQNVKITAELPVFLHHCEMCFACINWCPQKAINWTPLTKGKQRYQCTGVSKEDVITGRFYRKQK